MSVSHYSRLTSAALLLQLAPAAQIDWQEPFNITSVDNLDTSGTLVAAVNATSGGDSFTVNVGGENILFAPSPLASGNTNTGTFYTGEVGTPETPTSTGSSTATVFQEAPGRSSSPD